MIDEKGYRAGIGIVLVNSKGQLFWAKRVQQKSYQFPQGGMAEAEVPEETLYRELYEEIGLRKEDVRLIYQTQRWLRYQLPKQFLRHGSLPLCIGQKQKWFLLELIGDEKNIKFDTSSSPEFDDWRWVDYWHPLKEVINFKKRVYKLVLKEFESKLPNSRRSKGRTRGYLARRSRRQPY